jgi:cell division septation protein DedD
VRVAFFVLLALNAVYLAWAGWIDRPVPPVVESRPGPTLPELALSSELRSLDQTQSDAAPSGNGPLTQTVATVGDENPSRSETASSRCVSVGPFNDLSAAARGAALLRERGLDPKQRAEPGEMWEGFWVFVGGLKSTADEAKVVKTLEGAGIKDAHAMPESAEGRRVSVGLFTERARAEKRAQAVKRLGYAAEIVERKQPATVYWVDLEMDANERTVPTEGLLSIENTGARLEIRVCPERPAAPSSPKPAPLPRDARPAATTADAGAPRPG